MMPGHRDNERREGLGKGEAIDERREEAWEMLFCGIYDGDRKGGGRTNELLRRRALGDDERLSSLSAGPFPSRLPFQSAPPNCPPPPTADWTQAAPPELN
jgi:hypothetical protein